MPRVHEDQWFLQIEFSIYNTDLSQELIWERTLK
jgi:hypothetical protein